MDEQLREILRELITHCTRCFRATYPAVICAKKGTLNVSECPFVDMAIKQIKEAVNPYSVGGISGGINQG